MLLLIIPSEPVLPNSDVSPLIQPTTHEHRPDKHSVIRHSGRFRQRLLRQYAFLRITEKHDYPG
ncbi:hypothetical protein DNU50_20020 [Salmonella enterica subsp. enterica serovar Warnow]|uniref:Uncharacterized protein n=1 Tax=Salmonella potsdam TaxID=597 RepID=A0A702CA82_SALPO|nr:hypothetical protein [Salmonella enterica]EBR0106703.1 hypothetical protein [Salmonella enterica subsp. enterica serovar Warnow]EBS5974212.1 hypothetical protein [Salmonella enterica subsp. enterica serovar Thompson]EBV1469961.1 hypothetical protein [Salmonella enterica subsp. enterica serovar Braenderup]EBV5749811.1 hypothetical protein [Salmonella enterica subsp. enterica serovar Inverness]ECF7127055.1 hypothetical protein [Salmonella enterica subsp. enterica]HAC6704380.1 hypothetical pr